MNKGPWPPLNLERHSSSQGLDPQDPETQRIWSEVAEQVLQLMIQNPETLRSHLYRLDVDEDALRMAFKGGNRAHHQIAWLILKREWEKHLSRKKEAQERSSKRSEDSE